ncbi:hypothetical protein [Synechococcus sp. PCC 7336]|uniref:hypothetical protein n=1 Tax=Synechococcus sp. PCC 7336 TaxID=195250 RepID=UPI00034AA681|nr:hypothetical protein [Synechococcus sp. PCC 7336]
MLSQPKTAALRSRLDRLQREQLEYAPAPASLVEIQLDIRMVRNQLAALRQTA